MITKRTMEQMKRMGVKPEQIKYTEGQFPSRVKKVFVGFVTRNGNKFTKKYKYIVVFKNMDCFDKANYAEYYNA